MLELSPEQLIDYKKSGIFSFKMHQESSRLISDVRARVNSYFSEPSQHYALMSDYTYRTIVAEAQDEINALSLTTEFCRIEKQRIKEILQIDDLLVTRTSYLRATRPNKKQTQESVGFHRESFWHENMKYGVNIWIPLLNVTPLNSLQYVPESQKISDSNIETINEGEKSSTVEKHSAGHKIGLLYDVKTITGGVDFSNIKRISLPEDHYVIFDTNLIHGAASNESTHIRFSLDFRVLPSGKVDENPSNFASQGKMWTRFE
ncbi:MULTISPECIES: phytanoyl-CoA dioxygenase family protein [Alphaproteobacteria]|uniref:phytanoyl-CoA dioxygenase family protein n=1 Tax=Alphaproteobacteria TaxID=28211 RepID=UPI00326545D2